MNKFLLIIVAAFILTTLKLNAQTLIKANDKSIRYDLIKSSHYFRKVTVFDTLQNINYELVNECIINNDSISKEITFKRFRQFPFGKQFYDSSVVSFSNPVSYFMTSSPLTKKLNTRFNVKTVETDAYINGISSTVITPMNEGYFDDNIIETIIGFIPFKKGMKYHLETYRFESKEGKNPYDIEYLFDEIIQYAYNKVMNCSVLRIVNGYSETFVWIDKATHINVKEVIQDKNSIVLVQLL